MPLSDPIGFPASTERKLTVSVPQHVLRQLKKRVADDETTIRALILEALRDAGYDVPETQIRDRRRTAI